MVGTRGSVSSNDSHRGSQQIYDLAMSIGMPNLIARRISELAISNSEEMKRHMTLILTKADLPQCSVINTNERRTGMNEVIQTVNLECPNSTIELKFRIINDGPEEVRTIISGVRRSQYITQEIEELTYEQYETLRNTTGAAIDVMADVVNPLNDLYSRAEVSVNRFRDSPLARDSTNWYRRFGDTTNIEEMSDTGKTVRTKPLFEPLKAEFTPMLKLGEQITALKAYENISTVEYDRGNNYIKIKTKMIKSGKRNIGEFEIMLNLRDQNAVMRRLQNNFFKGDSMLVSMSSQPSKSKVWCAHPFVEAVTKKGFGKICFGDSFSIYQDAINNGDYFSAANLVLELLVTKTGNPYTAWAKYYKLVDAKADNIDPKNLVEKNKKRKNPVEEMYHAGFLRTDINDINERFDI